MLGRAIAYAYLGTSLWLWGYLYGHHVGGHEALDSDPDLERRLARQAQRDQLEEFLHETEGSNGG